VSSVDIVVPCYNYARYLHACVGSALSQPGVDVRVLIIDDTSTDNSQEVGETLAREDSRVTYRRHEKNVGHIGTYNEGLLDWCQADYTLLLSADDALSAGALSHAAALLDANPQIGFAYGLAVFFTDDAEIVQDPNPVAERPDTQIIGGLDFLKRCFTIGNPVPTPTAVVRTHLQQSLGGYRPDLPHSGDMEMWMRFARHSSVGVIGRVQAYYRTHSTNMSLGFHDRWIGDRREQLEACSEVSARWAPTHSSLPLMLGQMSKRLALEALDLASKAYDSGYPQDARRCVEVALEFDPDLRRTPQWRKYAAKCLIGNHAWRAILPLWSRLCGSSDAGAWPPQISASRQLGRRHGWWPDKADLTAH
jgi:hypothetical protein